MGEDLIHLPTLMKAPLCASLELSIPSTLIDSCVTHILSRSALAHAKILSAFVHTDAGHFAFPHSPKSGQIRRQYYCYYSWIIFDSLVYDSVAIRVNSSICS